MGGVMSKLWTAKPEMPGLVAGVGFEVPSEDVSSGIFPRTAMRPGEVATLMLNRACGHGGMETKVKGLQGVGGWGMW